MKYMIMLHGHPISGKSFAAQKIKEHLEDAGFRAEIIKSVRTRQKKSGVFSTAFIDEDIEETRKEKDDAYAALCRIAEDNLKKGIIPILDATFHKRHRREWVYGVARKTGTTIIAVWLQFNDEDEIRRILKNRQDNHDMGDKILSTWDQYLVMAQQHDAISGNEMEDNHNLSIIRFDRRKKSFEFHNCSRDDRMISIVCRALGE